MMKLIDSQTQSLNSHRKVRLKCSNVLMRMAVSNIFICITLLCAVNRVSCDDNNRHNRPPRFIIDDHHSEIVLRLKEGPDTPVGNLYAKFT